MVRSILAIVAGAVAGSVVIFAVEELSSLIHPTPPGFDFNDPAAVREFLSHAPVSMLLIVALAGFLGTMIGAVVAVRIARRAPVGHALMIGGFFLAAGVANLIALPHPAWFWPVDLAAFPLGAYAGLLIGRRQQPAVSTRP